MPVFLSGEFHGQRGLAGYSPWGCKESDMTERLTPPPPTPTTTQMSDAPLIIIIIVLLAFDISF